VALPAATVISLVVDVTSFIDRGFIGISSFLGEPTEIEFDEGDKGIFLVHAMAKRLSVRKGSEVFVLVEDDTNLTIRMTVAGVGATTRISSAPVYSRVGKEGGAIIRLQKA